MLLLESSTGSGSGLPVPVPVAVDNSFLTASASGSGQLAVDNAPRKPNGNANGNAATAGAVRGLCHSAKDAPCGSCTAASAAHALSACRHRPSPNAASAEFIDARWHSLVC